jgi:hypothetical protein
VYGLAGWVASLAMLAGIGASAPPADATTLAIQPGSTGSVALWNGGVAWWGEGGIRFAAPGSLPRLIGNFPFYGSFAYNLSLDGGTAAGAPGSALAYGWYEVNNEVPPMGPGDTNVPPPPIPYGSAILHRGVIGSDGSVTELPECNAVFLFGPPSQDVSVAGGSLAYGCAEPSDAVPPGDPAPAYVALAGATMPASVQAKVPQLIGSFQLSGDFLAYLAGESGKAFRVIVKNLATNTVAYEVPQAGSGPDVLALQEDGSVVLLGQGTTPCPSAHNPANQSYPAEWLPVASPTPRQLGCFFDGSLRPVRGKWVALAPGPRSGASLASVDLASGARTTLAAVPEPGMVESQRQPLAPAADFDGTHLAWTLQTCAGDAIQLTEVGAMSPGPPPSDACPVRFHIRGPLRIGARGTVRVPVSCPLGCTGVDLSIARPRALARDFAAVFTLAPSPGAHIVSFRLGRRELAYARRHGHAPIKLAAEVDRLGNTGVVRFTATAPLAG